MKPVDADLLKKFLKEKLQYYSNRSDDFGIGKYSGLIDALETIDGMTISATSVEANCEYQCNKCKFYEGVHNVLGHAPCSLWKLYGVMWNNYCSRFTLWKEKEVKK